MSPETPLHCLTNNNEVTNQDDVTYKMRQQASETPLQCLTNNNEVANQDDVTYRMRQYASETPLQCLDQAYGVETHLVSWHCSGDSNVSHRAS